MKNGRFLLKVVLIIISTFLIFVCQKREAENNMSTLPQNLPSISPTLNINSSPVSTLPQAKSNQNSSIRSVDFKNFTFTFPDSSENFTLKNGAKDQVREKEEDGAKLIKIEYGDVTGDGEDEAMIDVSPLMDGNCQCEMVFIYTTENKKPKLLWSFDTWDKAVGGFKRAYAENGELVIELFGDDRFENDKWNFSFPEANSKGYCCPTAYTKTFFKWNGKKFEPTGERELFDYDSKNSSKKNQ